MLLPAMDCRPPLLFRADRWVKHTGRCQAPEAIASILGFMGVRQLQRTHGFYATDIYYSTPDYGQRNTAYFTYGTHS